MHFRVAIVKFGLIYLNHKLVSQDDKVGNKGVLIFIWRYRSVETFLCFFLDRFWYFFKRWWRNHVLQFIGGWAQFLNVVRFGIFVEVGQFVIIFYWYGLAVEETCISEFPVDILAERMGGRNTWTYFVVLIQILVFWVKWSFMFSNHRCLYFCEGRRRLIVFKYLFKGLRVMIFILVRRLIYFLFSFFTIAILFSTIWAQNAVAEIFLLSTEFASGKHTISLEGCHLKFEIIAIF